MSVGDAIAMRKQAKQQGPKPFACEVEGCEKRFHDRSKLKRHKLVHSGERPFVCPHTDCERRFSLDYNLKSHISSVHAGDRPHKCPHPGCGKRFAARSNLKSHKNTHRETKRQRPAGTASGSVGVRNDKGARRGNRGRAAGTAIGSSPAIVNVPVPTTDTSVTTTSAASSMNSIGSSNTGLGIPLTLGAGGLVPSSNLDVMNGMVAHDSTGSISPSTSVASNSPFNNPPTSPSFPTSPTSPVDPEYIWEGSMDMSLMYMLGSNSKGFAGLNSGLNSGLPVATGSPMPMSSMPLPKNSLGVFMSLDDSGSDEFMGVDISGISGMEWEDLHWENGGTGWKYEYTNPTRCMVADPRTPNTVP